MNEDEKQNNFWEKLIFLDGADKEEVALNVTEEGRLNKLYWLQLFLAAVIATLGLLQNSIPVVIGVMLIAPLLRPIQAFSFGLVNTHSQRTLKAFKDIFLSVVLVVFSSILITLIIPVQLETAEVLARTNPNILDFFIAGASAAIAFLALVYKKKLSMSIAGVAMAASLLPPLSVIGIELTYKHYFLAWNSFLLFITNLVAIIFVGILLFFIFGFRAHQDNDKEKFKKNILILFLTISIISLPLLVSILNLKNNFQKERFIKNEINNLNKNIIFKNIKIFRNKENLTQIKINASYDERNNIEEIKILLEKVKKKYNKKFNEKLNLELNLTQVQKIEI